MAETLRLTPGETVSIRKSSPELLEVEGAWAPGGKPPPPHFHPSQEEHFEVLEGTLTARVEGEERDLGPGDALDIPRGAKHQMWNRTGSPGSPRLWRIPGGVPRRLPARRPGPAHAASAWDPRSDRAAAWIQADPH